MSEAYLETRAGAESPRIAKENNMKIDTAGTYTLRYTATDECGNVGTKDRTLNVIAITYRTVLYADGTFIINEKSSDQARNEALHGSAQNVYIPFDPNDSDRFHRYEFNSGYERPWDNEKLAVKRVEIGSPISPLQTTVWFQSFETCESMNLALLDTSRVNSFASMFYGCRMLANIDVSNFDTSNATGMSSMFYGCISLTSLDLSSFDTSKVTSFTSMFGKCLSLASINVSSFNTSIAKSTREMFDNCDSLTSLDLSNFDTSLVTNMSYMFRGCDNLVTIFASSQFVTTQVSNSSSMFRDSRVLVGGAGTGYSGSHTDKTYARIDNPPDAPGYFTAKA